MAAKYNNIRPVQRDPRPYTPNRVTNPVRDETGRRHIPIYNDIFVQALDYRASACRRRSLQSFSKPAPVVFRSENLNFKNVSVLCESMNANFVSCDISYII